MYKLTCGFLDVMFLYPAENNVHDMVAGAVCFLVCLGILYRAEAHGRFFCCLWLPLAAPPLLFLYEEWASLAASPPSTLEDVALLLLIPLLRYGFSGLWGHEPRKPRCERHPHVCRNDASHERSLPAFLTVRLAPCAWVGQVLGPININFTNNFNR